MTWQNRLTDLLHLDFPLIMAPMFLVSNEAMMRAAMDQGILGTFPTLNYREPGELEAVLGRLQAYRAGRGDQRGTFGVNLIVQRTNPLYEKHLAACVEHEVPVFITSLGNPKQVIEAAHRYGGKVLCDVTNLEHARKVHDQGCDGFIAVGQGAGGHAGPYPIQVLIPALQREFPDKVAIAAGGIANGQGIASTLAAGGDGVSVGTRFVASHEAGVNDAYKQAIVDSRMDDIVLTTKISGTPCNIINTPYAKKIGYRQNPIERYLSKNKRTRKYFKMLVQWRGMKKLEQSILPANYKTLWSAGQSVELIDRVESVGDIMDQFRRETDEALARVAAMRPELKAV